MEAVSNKFAFYFLQSENAKKGKLDSAIAKANTRRCKFSNVYNCTVYQTNTTIYPFMITTPPPNYFLNFNNFPLLSFHIQVRIFKNAYIV